MAVHPPTRRRTYNHELYGVYGEFGAGADLRAFYLQSTILPSDLHRVSLISDISGSERWPVRDLFQRDVDNERVTEGILPYLQDQSKVKFFNPLTLTVLPMADDGDAVLTEMQHVSESQIRQDEQEWDCLTRGPYFRVRWIKGHPEYAVLEWNDQRTRLVAIDGQHRLSALKRYEHDQDAATRGDFQKWRIPIVVVCFRATSSTTQPRVLDVVRNIFVYINTEAKKVNDARAILLTDDSVNAVCTQELLQRSHSNDLLHPSERDENLLPLLFFDWRGEERSGQRIHTPAAMKSVEEIRDWFQYYILGDDFSDDQKRNLGIDPTHPLQQSFHVNKTNQTKKLDYHASEQLRDLVKQELMSAVSYVLQNFIPCKHYTKELRTLEYRYWRQSDLARHAFHELRFGTNPAMDANKGDVENVLEELRTEIGKMRASHFRAPFDRDIGMRGVMFAFGDLRPRFGYPAWMEYAKWFTEALNQAYENRWFDLNKKPGSQHLRQVAVDHNDSIINYRLNSVEDAIGAYIGLIVSSHCHSPTNWQTPEPAPREFYLEVLEDIIRRGYKKQVRPQLREKYPNGGKELTDAVNRKATKLAEMHIRRLEQALNQIDLDANPTAEENGPG